MNVCKPKPIMFGISLALSLLMANTTTMAHQSYAYPLAGHSPEQQARDDSSCRQWAQQATGVDPRQPPPQAQPYYGSSPSSSGYFGQGDVGGGGMVRDAAGGAALGAIGGGIAGNAGKGAAMGAAAGAIFGGIKRANRQQQEQQWQAQQQAQYQQQQQALNQQYQQGLANFNRAYGSCMSARKYQLQ